MELFSSVPLKCEQTRTDVVAILLHLISLHIALKVTDKFNFKRPVLLSSSNTLIPLKSLPFQEQLSQKNGFNMLSCGCLNQSCTSATMHMTCTNVAICKSEMVW